MKNSKKKIIISDELRKDIATAVVDEAEKQGVEGLSMDKDGFGGKVWISEGHSLDWRISKYGDFYTAGTLPTTGKSSTDYLLAAKDYEDAGAERDKLIKLSRRAAAREGVVGTALQAVVELASLSGWWVEEKNDELRRLLNYWLENINSIGDAETINSLSDGSKPVDSNGGIERLIINILYSILIDGDYVATEEWKNIDIPVIGGKRNLPVRFSQHDVLSLKIDEVLAQLGREVIYAKPSDEVVDIVKEGASNEKEKAILESLSPAIINAIKNEDDMFPLPYKLTVHLSGRNNDITAWGTPYLTRAFPAISYKHKIRALDNATIDGLIQRLWIVKIGHDDPQSKFHVPDNERVMLAVSALKKLKTHSLMVWGGSDISTEELKSSDSNVLGFSDRYQSADNDILQALGVPRVLIDGTFGSGKSGADDTAFAKIESQIERFQILIARFLNKKMRQIAVENGYKDSFPKFNFTFLKLISKDKVKNVVLNLYEKNLLGVRRSLYLMGMNGHDVVDELIAEKKEGLREKLPINIVPYSANPGRPEDVGDGDGTDGRNNNTSDPDSKRDGK